MEEFINSLHNTIDYNKEQIINLINKEGSINLKLIFEVNPLEIAKFKIECEKLATKEFYELKPYCIEEFLRDETKQP